MPIDAEDMPRLLRVAMLVLGLAACSPASLARPDGGNGGGWDVGGVSGSGGSGGLGGQGGHLQGTGDGGPTLDPSAGPCGQYVYDLATKCPDPTPGTICWLSGVPACPAPSGVNSEHLYSGCGYLIISQAIGEGDSQSRTYDLSTNKLVYYSTVGSTAMGCAVRGTRFGQEPTCDKWNDLCAN